MKNLLDPGVIIPGFEAVINDFVTFTPIVYEGLEFGTYKAREYFRPRKAKSTDDWPIADSGLAAYITRFQAKRVLKERGHESKNDEEEHDDYMLKSMSNSGIYVAYKQYRVRILKTNDGTVPSPRYSQTRRRFYEQHPGQGSLDFPGLMPGPSLNVILLWGVDSFYNLNSLLLACPNGMGMTTNLVKTHWIEPVPGEYLKNALPQEPMPQREELEDLAIFRSTQRVEIEGND